MPALHAPVIDSKLPQVGTTIFTVMSALAAKHGAVNLGQGFPDFGCDPRLLDAVDAAMREGHNQYPAMAGVPALRQAIATKIATLYGATYDPDTEITVTAGATQAIFTAIMAVVRAGEEVIVIEPMYDSYLPNIALAGAEAVCVPMTEDFRIDWPRVAAAVTPRTRAILVNTPHNPSGRILGSARILALEAIAVEQARRGDVDGAYETVVAIANPYRRSEAQAAIALSVARTGDISGAVRAASRIATDYWFTADQNSRKIPSGLVVRSREFDQFWFFEALAGIAAIEAAAGDVESALQTAHAIPDVAARSRALGRIAAVQAGLGDLEGARLTAQLIEGAYGDAEALIAMADAMAARGNMGPATDLARQIGSAYGNAGALVLVAGRLAEAGAITEALALAAEIGTIEHLTRARIAIARAHARRGEVAAALDLLARVPDRGEQVAAVAAICAGLAEAGDGAGALALAHAHARGPALDELMLAIALAQGRTGQEAAAVATAEGIEDALVRILAAAGLARIGAP